MANIIEFKNNHVNMSSSATALPSLLKKGEQNIVKLDGSTYSFDKNGTSLQNLMASCDYQGPKNTVFCFKNKEDLIIDGGGAELVFNDRISPFIFDHCKNVTLKNLSIDFSISRYCQGCVTQSDESGFTLNIDSSLFKVETDAEGHIIFVCGSDKFSTKDSIVLLGNEIFGKSPWDYIFAGDTTLSKENLPTGFIETDAEDLGNGLIKFNYRENSRRLTFNIGETLLFCYDPRANINIFINCCENVVLENVTIYRGGGMGIVAHSSCDTTFDGVNIMIKPGRPECRSTTADGVYIVQCYGDFIIRNSSICDTFDDALNIHGVYNVITEVLGGNRLITTPAFYVQSQIVPYMEGNKIIFTDKNDLNEKCEAVVLKTEIIDDLHTVIELDRNIAVNTGDYIENPDMSAKFVFENNRISRCPHMRVSGRAKKIIRNNVFEELSTVYVNDLMDGYYFETGCVGELIIENNRFINCPRSGERYSIEVLSSYRSGTNARHKNISIIGNSFENANGHAINISCADGVTILNNTLPENSDAILINDCSGVNMKK